MGVEVLPSSRERSATANLAEFVRRSRYDLAAFGTGLDFSSAVWELGPRGKVSSGHKNDRLYFTTREGGHLKGLDGRTPLAQPFADFIKAAVRAREEVKSKSANDHAVFIRAGRYLHDCLEHQGFDPTQLLGTHLRAAAQACGLREAPSSRYRIGLMLCEIADFLNRYGIVKARLDFKNPFSRDDTGTRFGEEFDRRRENLLPSEAALDALAQIANLVVEPADVLRMRCVELLVCGGWRINEVLTVPADCEVTEPAFENGRPLVDKDGKQIERYGIRCRAEKGFGWTQKWIPTAMVDVVKRAIRDIQQITQGARDLALWVEGNPGRAWLPPKFAEAEVLMASDIAEICGLAQASGSVWAKARGIPVAGTVRNHQYYRREDLEEVLVNSQPTVAADHPMKMSEYLFVMHLNFCHSDRATNHCVVDFLTDGRIDDFIQGRVSDRGTVRSVLSRFGFTEANGDPIYLTSHMFRHWLNTLMQRGGMGEHEIARWSGRKDVGQNAAYDHRSAVELAERMREMMIEGKVAGFIATVHDRLPPVDRAKFREATFATGHTTDLGLCVNDYSTAPCHSLDACGACCDLLVEKGNVAQRARAALLLEEHEWFLEGAEAEAQEETYGASNFVNHNRTVVEGLTRIMAVFDDPTIPDGTMVQVNAGGASQYLGEMLDPEGEDVD